jgi:hypothetical protein
MNAPTPAAAHAGEHLALSADLQRVLDEHADAPISIGELRVALGDRGFGLSMLLLSLPSALPVPAPGYSTPFGIALVALAVQMIRGRTTPWLPEKIEKRMLSPKFAKRMLGAAIAFLSRIEHLVKPRGAWVQTRWGLIVPGVLVMLMGGLMILPIPGTNTAPAMTIFLIGVGMLEEDGLLISGATLLAVAAAALYGGAVYFLVTAGMSIDETLGKVKSFLGV